MRITAYVEVNNRLLPMLNMRGKSKGSNCQLSIGKKPGQTGPDVPLYLMICNKQDRNGAKYKLKHNIQQCFTKFIQEGKATIRFLEPAHDICLSKVDPVQLKGFLSVVKLAQEGANMEKITLTPLAPASAKAVENLKTRMSIKKRSEYPITTGFPNSLESLQIVTCNLKKVDSRILLLKNLKILDLSNNCIVNLPTDFSKSLCLSELYLHGNKIASIPRDIFAGSLPNTLRLLDLSDNKLKMLPPDIGKLRNLVTLKVQCNEIVVLSNGVSKLYTLRHLHANDNQLKTLPAGFAELRLDTLDLFGNQFMEDGPSTRIDKLHFCSLLELSARAIKKHKVHYTEEDVSHVLIPYLNSAKKCLCTRYCFHSFVHYLYRLDLRRVAASVTSIDHNGRTHAPAEAFLCSKTCLDRYLANPYATMWRIK